MRRLKPLELAMADRSRLERIVARGRDWRERQRAQTLLYFGDGWPAKAIAAQQGLNRDTVYDCRKHWLAAGFAALADKPRCGAPRKLNEVQRQLLRTWASAEALTAPALRTRLQAECGVTVHPDTVKNALRQMKFVWKRTRHSLKKSGISKST